jgi:hypothetical protein
MEIALIFVIVLLIGYNAYKDYIFLKEREKLEMKLMSKNLGEYVSTISDTKDENTKEEEAQFVDIGDADYSTVLKSKDKL